MADDKTTEGLSENDEETTKSVHSEYDNLDSMVQQGNNPMKNTIQPSSFKTSVDMLIDLFEYSFQTIPVISNARLNQIL